MFREFAFIRVLIVLGYSFLLTNEKTVSKLGLPCREWFHCEFGFPVSIATNISKTKGSGFSIEFEGKNVLDY